MKKTIFNRILNQRGSTLMTVIGVVGLVGAGAYIIPDRMKETCLTNQPTLVISPGLLVTIRI